ncbi:hypothetical protein FMJ28_28210 [Klebsiella michiganensis]|uniref:hypothetical protein n=1 Tax=Klebsiella michiganensis TaxID=1134687 RepID=UPI001CCA0E9C|nr:hypothetical protein [Klebsiella michiganensis]MBZ7457129.1 hypothetical protein [Klebsiella michiganensis]
MIYPLDASYAQEVLRKHYQYADILANPHKSLAAKTTGLITHDRYLSKWDGDKSTSEIRRKLSRNTEDIETMTA